MSPKPQPPTEGRFPCPGEIYLVEKFNSVETGPVTTAVADTESPAPSSAAKKIVRGEGKFIRSSIGRGQYGHVVVTLEPNVRGKGLEIVSEIDDGAIPLRFIQAASSGIRAACPERMVAGRPLIDAVVRIVDGSFHTEDSSELAFKLAGIFAFQDAIRQAGPILLDLIAGIGINGEPGGGRFELGIIVSREDADGVTEAAVFVPLTTRRQRSAYSVFLGKPAFLGQETWTHVRGVTAVERDRLVFLLGNVDLGKIREIKAKLKHALDL